MTIRKFALALCCSASCTASPALADTGRDQLPPIFTMSPMGVNIQSGIYTRTDADVTIGSLTFQRAWRSFPTMPRPGSDNHFGGWDHNWDVGAQRYGSTNGVNIYADGRTYQFALLLNGEFVPHNIDQFNNNALGTMLTGTLDSNLIFRNREGDAHHMNAANMTTRIDYADGTRVDLTYDAQQRPRTILSSRGDALVIDWNAQGKIAAVCGYNRATTYVGPATTCASATLKATYGYTPTSSAQGHVLSSVTDVENVVTAMQYDNYFRNNLTCITVPGTSTCAVTNVYGPAGGEDPGFYKPDQVHHQVTATGETWNYWYHHFVDENPPQPGEIRYTSSGMVDPLGRSTSARYANWQIERLMAPEGETFYEWNGLAPMSVTPPGGLKQSQAYDARNNPTTYVRHARSGSGMADIAVSRGFPADSFCTAANRKVCNKPPSVIDAKGNRTDFTYAPEHGGVLTETRPAGASGVRPQKRYRYEQLYAGVKDAGGAIVSAAAPVWLLVEESQCRTQASCAGTADEIRTLYEYGASGTANALRLKGMVVTGDGVTSRTCFSYDEQGNKVSETGPGAGLASCP